MPGIVGLISRMPRERAERELHQMVEALRHESFYLTGTWVDESLGVYVGWIERRGSFACGMPLRNERSDVALIFSGEVFPEPGTGKRLKERGHELDAAASSYLVHLYEEDSRFPLSLNGRFHALLIDQSQGSVALFNDRYGMHRLYYHESKDAFYFAAEAKAILAVRPELRRIDPRGLGEFITCGCTLEWRTLFDGVSLLPGASKWIFQNGTLVRKEQYFDPSEWESQEQLEPELYYTEFKATFARNLQRYFEGQQQIGMSLTGGLDTRMVMSWQTRGPGSLPCFTFGSMVRENQDVRVARRVAEICKQPFHVIPAGPEFLSHFQHYAERVVYLTDGCVDVGRAPDLYLNEKVRQIAPVRMTGNYGGEILRGFRAFKAEDPLPGLFRPDLLSSVRQASATYAGLLRHHPVTFAAFKQSPWHHFGILALEQTQLSMRSPFLDNDLVQTVFRAPLSALLNDEPSLRLIAAGNPSLASVPTDRGVGGNYPGPLKAAHRAALEFLFKAEYAYDMGMPQWVARIDHTLSRLHLERLFLGRHKVFHFRIWYRDTLAEYLKEILLDTRSLSRPYIERKGLETVVLGHLKGNRNYTNEIHKILTLELIHRLFIDKPAPSDFKTHSGVLAATAVDH